ncbi:MAG TPA: pyridoxal-phosphate dependent enzyme [Parachlamydiaceae bacterium]|nr:pyridoxal-phosphate dependent enzyme [Parachlamydiaceae bacterium]
MDLLYVQTPILESLSLSKGLGIPVFLKMEALQPTSSYKARAAGLLISDHVTKGEQSFITASSCADEALSLANACRVLNCTLKLVVPSKIFSPLMKEKILEEGAEILEEGSDFQSAVKIAKSFADSQKIPFIDLLNNPLSKDGISTLIYEIFGAGLKPGAILLYPSPDLLMGVCQGLKSCKWADVPIITAESEVYCPFATALLAGKRQAEGINHHVFETLESQTIYPHIVEEEAVLDAWLQFANEQLVLIDKKQAAPLGLAHKKLPLLKTFSSLLIIVSGGADVNLSTFKEFC